MFQTDIKKLLALFTLGGFFTVIAALFFIDVPAGNLDLAKTLMIALISMASAVAGYYFGSSEGSARKTELLSPSATDPAAPIVTRLDNAGRCTLPILLVMMLSMFIFTACVTTQPSATPAVDSNSTSKPPSLQASPIQTAGKSLLAVKSSIVVSAKAVDVLCKSRTLAADKCAQARTAYESAKPAYDAAVDAYLLMTSSGGDPAEFGRTLLRVQDLASNLLALSGGAQ